MLFRGIDRAPPQIRDTIAGALASGSLADAMGRQIPFGSAVVILAAPATDPGPVPDGQNPAALLALTLGPTLVGACDVIALKSGPLQSPTAARGSGLSCWTR